MEIKPNFSGECVMIAAGTGILPFIDLLDLLLKKQLYQSIKSRNQDTSSIKPVQDYDQIFPGARFKLLCAFRTIEDFIGWEWIDKLAELSKKDGSNLFECSCYLSSAINFKGITHLNKHFSTQFLEQHISKNTDKIWICGPPAMQATLYTQLESLKIDTELIHYV